jgi:hypothetical protein
LSLEREAVFFNEQDAPARATDFLEKLNEEEQNFFLLVNDYLVKSCEKIKIDPKIFMGAIFKITKHQAKNINHAQCRHFEEFEVRAKCFTRAVDGLFKKDLKNVQSPQTYILGAFKQNWKEWLPPENKAERR